MNYVYGILAGLNVANLLGGVALGVIFSTPIKAILYGVLAKLHIVQ